MAEKPKKGLFGLGRKKTDAAGGDSPSPKKAEENPVSPNSKAGPPPPAQPSGDGGAKLYRHLEALSRMGTAPASTSSEASASGAKKLSSPQKAIETVKSGQAAKVRQKRLMKELRDIRNSAAVKNGVFTAELFNDNLFEWDVKLKQFDPDSKLAQDLLQMKRVHGIDDVWLRVSFPDNYPFDPPFVRVLAPLVQGGYVLTGGAICMELLTPEGWSQAYTVEAVIMQTMATMIKGEARIVARVKREFSETEARKAYDYLVKTHARHGWNTPPKAEG
eukprot:m.26372 g.26372  ORF g.26372 m.26372 type:complete len:275 (-) comp7789_c0_seq1:107-931(-)